MFDLFSYYLLKLVDPLRTTMQIPEANIRQSQFILQQSSLFGSVTQDEWDKYLSNYRNTLFSMSSLASSTFGTQSTLDWGEKSDFTTPQVKHLLDCSMVGSFSVPISDFDESEWCFLGEMETPFDVNIYVSVTEKELESLSLWRSLLSDPNTDVHRIKNEVLSRGIPNEFRGVIWQFLLGYRDSGEASDAKKEKQRNSYVNLREKYFSSVSLKEDSLHGIVMADVMRTHPDGFYKVFHNSLIQESLTRILYIWSKENVEVSYFQGLNDLASIFFLVFMANRFGALSDYENEIESNLLFSQELTTLLPLVEADTYWCLSKMMNQLSESVSFTTAGIHAEVMLNSLVILMEKINQRLVCHLKKLGVEFIMFAFRWILCFFSRELSFKNLLALWDNYLAQGNLGFAEFHIYVCAALLQELSPALLASDNLCDCIYLLQRPPSLMWKNNEIVQLVNQARELWSYYTISHK
eukprot:TRINITY_DN6406_c0_g1_i1.p1 TRINITY_DN6406_c0_g1~~TRINITY_DN6406_c0_g1_i1.p1  ORF type:complete len:466 (-),score=61.71 TRINITY_DN6406_c0_g1_i1:64-1461(-)